MNAQQCNKQPYQLNINMSKETPFCTQTDDGEEYIGPITNAPLSKSKQTKSCSMKGHFNYFLMHFWSKHNKSDKIVSKFDDLEVEDVTIDIVDNFVNYLASHARKGFKADGPLLKFGTIDQYLSSFKMSLVRKFFKNESELIVNNQAKMSLLRSTMLQKKIQQCRRDGIEIMSSLETASETDVDTFFLLCFWEGTYESAEFLHLMMSCIANCGRGSEVCSQIKIILY